MYNCICMSSTNYSATKALGVFVVESIITVFDDFTTPDSLRSFIASYHKLFSYKEKTSYFLKGII